MNIRVFSFQSEEVLEKVKHAGIYQPNPNLHRKEPKESAWYCPAITVRGVLGDFPIFRVNFRYQDTENVKTLRRLMLS